MDSNDLVPFNFLVTLIIAAVALIVVFAVFYSKRRNRHPMAKSDTGAIATVRDGEQR